MVVLPRIEQTTARRTPRKDGITARRTKQTTAKKTTTMMRRLTTCPSTTLRSFLVNAMEKMFATYGILARRVVDGTQTARHGHGRILRWVGSKCANYAHLFFNCTCGWIPLFRFDYRTDSFFHCNVHVIASPNARAVCKTESCSAFAWPKD